jgi:hypothetical protein
VRALRPRPHCRVCALVDGEGGIRTRDGDFAPYSLIASGLLPPAAVRLVSHGNWAPCRQAGVGALRSAAVCRFHKASTGSCFRGGCDRALAIREHPCPIRLEQERRLRGATTPVSPWRRGSGDGQQEPKIGSRPNGASRRRRLTGRVGGGRPAVSSFGEVAWRSVPAIDEEPQASTEREADATSRSTSLIRSPLADNARDPALRNCRAQPRQ